MIDDITINKSKILIEENDDIIINNFLKEF